MKGDNELSNTAIQLSSPLPSPSVTPNCQLQHGSSQQQSYHRLLSSHALSQHQIESSSNILTLPPLILDPPRPTSPSSVYPLANTSTPSGLERIKFTIDNRPSLLEEIPISDTPPYQQSITSHERLEDISTVRDSSEKKRRTSIKLEDADTPKADIWSPTRKKQRSDTTTTTPILDTDHLILELNNIMANSTSAPDELDTNTVDSPNSVLPSPMSDIDSVDENWAMDDTHTEEPSPMTSAPTDMIQNSNSGLVNDFGSSLLHTYSDLPTGIQDYFMYQLLRRSPMSSLRLASDVITQVLKTDFITCLPSKLSQQILLCLDPRSLCRASGVSRRWKQLIEGDADLWRTKIVEAGFTLTDAEINRYDIGPEHLYQQHHYQRDQGTDDSVASISESTLVQASSLSAPSPASSYVSSSSMRSSCGLVTSPCRSLIKRETALNSLDIEYLDQPFMDASLAHTSNDPTLFYRQALSLPNYNTLDHEISSTHPFLKIYKQHHIMRQNWKHNRVKRQQIKGHGDVVTCLQFDDDKIITGFDDTYIKVHDIRTGMLRRILRGHEGGVWALQYIGNTLVTGSTDRTIRIFDIEQGICRFVFRGHTSTVRCLQIVIPTMVTGPKTTGIQPSQPLIVSGSRDKTLRVWKLPYLPEPQGRRHDTDTEDMDSNEESSSNMSQLNGIPRASQHYDTHTHHKETQEYDYNPFFIHLLQGHTNSVRALAAHANCLASGSYDNTVKLWDLDSGTLNHTLVGHPTKVYSVAIDPQRQQCISGSMDSTIRIWNILDGSCERILRGHSMLVGLLGISKNHMVSGGADGTLRVWPADGYDDCKHILAGHKRPITSFHHDDIKVVSGSEGGLKMWDTQTGELLHDLIDDVDGIWWVGFDERRCVAAVKSENTTRLEILDYGTDTEAD